jgi:hypothetical protein
MRLAPTVKGLLTGEQLRKLPPFIASYLEPRYLASIRSGTAAFTSGSMLPGAPVVMMGGGGPAVGAQVERVMIHAP